MKPTDIKQSEWDNMTPKQQRFWTIQTRNGELTIKEVKERMGRGGKKSKGRKNPNAHFALKPEVAREMGLKRAEQMWGK
jgi:hypothetical protein